jgi:uncharacterized protein
VSVEPVMLAFAVVVFVAYGAQTVTGFGSMLVCVTLGAHLLPIEQVVTLAVPVSLVQTGYISVRHAAGIRWRLFWTRVIPLMGGGMALGMMVRDDLGGDWLRGAFAVMMIVLATRELWVLHRARRERAPSHRPIPPAAAGSAMIGAGVIHAIYATGGPLLVYALGRSGLDKYAFRSTLTAIWLALNSALAIGFLVEGRYDASTAADLAVLLPAVPLGIIVGEVVHRRVDEHRFKNAVFALLIAAAVSLLLR